MVALQAEISRRADRMVRGIENHGLGKMIAGELPSDGI
jgi:hypothetical protein